MKDSNFIFSSTDDSLEVVAKNRKASKPKRCDSDGVSAILSKRLRKNGIQKATDCNTASKPASAEQGNAYEIKLVGLKKVAVKSDKFSKQYPESSLAENRTQAELEKSIELSILLDGSREVKTIDGRIDVLTNDFVIEVKEAKNWKHAIGQVFIYQHHYPDRRAAVFLFGDDVDFYASRAELHCKKLGIVVATSPTQLNKPRLKPLR
jgi:hypothetical protein